MEQRSVELGEPVVGGDRTWAIKGVRDETRDAVRETAHEAGLAIGAWVDRVLARAAEEARHPKPPAASRADVAEVVQRAVAEGLRPVVERLEQLERKTARLVRAAEGDKIDQLPNLGAPQPSPARPAPPAVESAEPTLIEPQATAAEQEPAIEPVPVDQTSYAAEEGPHPSDDNSARPISNIAKFMRELHGRTTSKSTERDP